MNFRNRYLVITIRILLGLIMLASGISGLLMGNSTQGVPAKMVAFTQVFWASGIFQMVKVTEIVAGFMLLVGIFPVRLALSCPSAARKAYRRRWSPSRKYFGLQ